MSPIDLSTSTRLAIFNIEIAHEQLQIPESLPQKSARGTLEELRSNEDMDGIAEITNAVDQVNKVVLITRENDNEPHDLIDIFTAPQIKTMATRIYDYLGMDIDSHLKKLSRPLGYPFYIGRLATHFSTTDTTITSGFGGFEKRHINPTETSTGPYEHNSREYANEANERLLKQLDSFYQADFDIKLVGPTKTVEGSRTSWERGIAECQFLVLDYVRDVLATGHSTAKEHVETSTMTIGNIHDNITNLLINRRRLIKTVSEINPILAEQVESGINDLSYFTAEVFHRGRLGTPRYQKDPIAARKAIQNIEALLLHAASLSESREDQAEIPILEF